MKIWILIAVLFAACAAQTQNLKIVPAHLMPDRTIPSNVQFLCTQHFEQTECVKDATALRQAMLPYPMQLLGSWAFVLVPADDWKPLVRGQGGDPVSPAFSMLDQRVTLLDASLFGGTAVRNKELLERFGVIGPALVDLAITHEMGHAICQEKREREADGYGKELRERRIPDCGKTVDPNVGLDLPAEIIEAMRNAWLSASLGNSPNEAGFYYNGTINPVAHTNQNGKLSFNIPAGTTAVFHTHPQGHDPMSQQDIDIANQNHIDMYVISRSGLYHYRPGMKAPEMLQAGTDYLAKKKAAQKTPGTSPGVATASTVVNSK